MTTWLILAVVAQLAIIAGALTFTIREIQAQTPRNSHRHYGGL